MAHTPDKLAFPADVQLSDDAKVKPIAILHTRVSYVFLGILVLIKILTIDSAHMFNAIFLTASTPLIGVFILFLHVVFLLPMCVLIRQDLLRLLLCRAEGRLGSGPDGVNEIKRHPFYKVRLFVATIN
jgi:hypothetical protein